MAKKQFNINTELTAKIDDLTSKLNTANKRVGHFKNEAKKNKGEGDMFKPLIAGAIRFLPIMGAAATAQEVFKGVTTGSQVAGDAWAIQVEGMKGALDAFYRTLGTGDWSNFFTNIIKGTEAGKKFAKAMDDLTEGEWSLRINNSLLEKDIAEADRQMKVAKAEQNWTEVIRLSYIIDEQEEQKLKNVLEERQRAYAAYRDKVNSDLGFEGDQLVGFLEGYRKNGDLMKEAEAFNKKLETLQIRLKAQTDLGFLGDDKKIKEAEDSIRNLKNVTENDVQVMSQILKKYGGSTDDVLENLVGAWVALTTAQTDNIKATKKAASDRATAERYLNGEIDAVDDLTDSYVELNKAKEAPVSKISGFKTAEVSTDGGVGVDDGDIAERLAASSEAMKGETLSRIELLELESNAINSIGNAFDQAANAASRFGNDTIAGIFNVIGAMTGMMQAINTINLLKAQEAATSAIAAGAPLPFPANLVAMSTGLAAVMSLMSSIPKFAVGGVVGGDSFTGDTILAGLNSGERILTAEQNKIFEGLAKRENGVSGNVTFEIRGDKLMGVLDNYNNRSRSYG